MQESLLCIEELRLLRYLPLASAQRDCILPFRLDGQSLHLACEESLTNIKKDEWSAFFGEHGFDQTVFCSYPAVEIRRCIQTYYTMAAEDAQLYATLHNLVQEGDFSYLLDFIIRCALDASATDVHMSYDGSQFFVRFRIHGTLTSFCILDAEKADALVRVTKVRSQIDLSAVFHPKDGRMRFVRGREEADIRVSVLPSLQREKIHLRLLSPKDMPLRLSELHMEESAERVFAQFLKRNGVFILICGPTGSGKSTTLRCCLSEMNDGRQHIVSLEDPVEYKMAGVTQIQVNREAQNGFADALRAVLRNDPDVIYIGEIRDYESAGIAMKSAMTGHVVLSTLHAKSTWHAFDRLLDLGIDQNTIASSLSLIVNQRLVACLCPSCKQASVASEDISQLSVKAGDAVFEARGCSLCHYTGYAKRIPVLDILVMDEEKERAVRRQGSHVLSKETENGILGQVVSLLHEGEIDLDSAESFLGGTI